MSPPRLIARHLLVALLLACAGFETNTVWAQPPQYAMTDTTVTDCFGELTDSGGTEEAYGNNEDLVFTIEAGSPLDVGFIGSIDIEPAAPGGLLFDYLVLHDGPGLSSPVLDTLFGNIANPPSYTTSGPLTVHFVSDASAQPQGFHLTWTADPPPPVPPEASLGAPGNCPFTAVNLDFSYPIECSLIDWSSLSFSATNGQTWAPDTSAAAILSCSGTTNDALIIPFEDGQSVDGNCTVTANLFIGVRDACDSIWTLPIEATWTSMGCPATPEVITDTDTVCTGGCATLEALQRGCEETNLTWTASDGSTFNGPGPWNVCPVTTTTYTATANEVTTGTTGQASVTVTVLDLGAWVQDTSICPGAEVPLSTGSISGEWSGTGVIGPPWLFDSGESGQGAHDITFTAFGSASCASTATITVVNFWAPNNVPTCPESAPFELPAAPPGGTWTGTGITGNTFDPSAVVTPGQDTVIQVLFSAGACQNITNIHIEPAAPLIDIGSICQSEPAIPLPSSPPGGTWTGPGLSEDADAFLPEEAPAGPITLTYQMQGCNRLASGTLLPIYAGPTMSSCPEQLPFVPYPDFLPAGGNWEGPGIALDDSISGLYQPGNVPDNQWSPLIYSAPNGCTDTLWMFNRQTTIAPDVLHACASDTANLLANGLEVSPWCGIWNGLGTTNPTDLGDCDWSINAPGLSVGEHRLTYTVNGCADTLDISVHPDSLNVEPWVSCNTSAEVLLPILPAGAQWSGPGIQTPTNDSTWSWSPGQAGPGAHTLLWTNPAGCSDNVAVEVESAPVWNSISDTILCFNEVLISPPPPALESVTSGSATTLWTINDTDWLSDTSTAEIGSGTHLLAVQWSGEACSTDTAWTLQILDPLSVALTADDLVLCPGAGTQATAVITGGLAPTGSLDIAWSDEGLPLSTRTLIPTVTSWWSVSVGDGCSTSAEDSILLTVLPPFDTDITFGPLACHNAPTSLVLDVPSPAGVQHFIDGSFAGNGPVVVDALAGSALAWSVLDTLEGCALDTTILVPGHPPIAAAFSVNPAADCIPWDAQPIGLIDLSTGAESGQWSWFPSALQGMPATPDSVAWTAGSNPLLTLPSAGTWTVIQAVQQDVGCTDTVSSTICVLPQTNVWLPDAFSPNGDGANDRFRPRGSGVSTWRMTIHDGWGRLVWEESQVGLPAGSALQATTEEGFPIGWAGDQEAVGVYAVRLEATTDGGVPIIVEQPLRLIR